MFPNVNPKQMKNMMKKMGMKQQEIEAEQVIIKQKDKELVINNPEVQKIEVMGQESLQITGDIEERPLSNEEDVKIVMEQVDVSKEKAEVALEKNDGDIAKAILELQNP